MAEEESRDRGHIYTTAVAIVVTFIWAVAKLPGVIRDIAPEIRAGNLAAMAGTVFADALFISVIVWLFLYFIFLRRRAEPHGSVSFAILFVVALAVEGGGIGLAKTIAERHDSVLAGQEAQFRIAVLESQKAIATMMSANGGAIDTHVRAQGEAGEFERTTKQFAAQATVKREAYQARMTALDFAKALSPSWLASDPHAASALASVIKAQATLQDYRRWVDSVPGEYRALIAGAKVNAKFKEQFLLSFDRSVAQMVPTRDRMLDYNDRILAESKALADFLAHPKSPWSVRGNTIVFTNAADLDAYRTHRLNLQSLAREQAAFIAAERAKVLQELQTPPPQH